MKSKKFPSTLHSKIEQVLELELSKSKPVVAAFDADGTLWDTDLGEGFFQFQIREKLIPHLPPDPWEFYRKMKSGGNPRPAYLWLAQINKGFPLSEVRKWAAAYVQSLKPAPLFPEQLHLIEYLISKGVLVYVVTASIKWSVEPGAALFGIPEHQVLGVACQAKSSRTDQQEGPITYRQGKAEALLMATGGVAPFLSCGNSTGDVSLLEIATQIPIAVRSAPKGHELFQTEEELSQLATQKGWFKHHF